MGVVVITLLLGLWGLVLLPGVLRERRLSSPIESVEHFERAMSLLASGRTAPGRHIMVLRDPRVIAQANRRSHVLRRRRVRLARLAAALPVTVLLAVVLGGAVWALAGLSAAALLGYVGALAVQRRRELHARKVRALPQRSHAPQGPPAVTAARPGA